MKTGYEALSLPQLIKATRSFIKKNWNESLTGDDAVQLCSLTQEIMQRWASENPAVNVVLEKTVTKPKPQKTMEQRLAEDAAFIKECGYDL